jgi:ribokinase
MTRPDIAVIGSVNLDLVASVERFPLPGETLTNAVVGRFPGGKGANQALAARRLGANVSLVACVGNDPAAEEALHNLRNEHVDLTHCKYLKGSSTGLAIILVDANGENQIVVAPGANAEFKPDLLTVPVAQAVIAQLELPTETVVEVARRVSLRSDCLFCLNAAPAKPVPAELLALTDLLIVNETEADFIGPSLDQFHGLLVKTLGSRGAVLQRAGQEVASATPPRIEVVDTTGAGDTFTAAMVVGLASGLSADMALQQACYAGALSTMKSGAQSSPTAVDVVNAMN